MSQEEYIKCKYHSKKKAKKFCIKCKEFICNACAIDMHSIHMNDIKSLNLLYANEVNKIDNKANSPTVSEEIKEKIDFFMFLLNFNKNDNNDCTIKIIDIFDDYLSDIIECKNYIKNIIRNRKSKIEEAISDSDKAIADIQNKIAMRTMKDIEFINKINLLNEKMNRETNIDELCEVYIQYDNLIDDVVKDRTIFSQYKKRNKIEKVVKEYNDILLKEIEPKMKIIEETIKEIYKSIEENEQNIKIKVEEIIKEKEEVNLAQQQQYEKIIEIKEPDVQPQEIVKEIKRESIKEEKVIKEGKEYNSSNNNNINNNNNNKPQVHQREQFEKIPMQDEVLRNTIGEPSIKKLITNVFGVQLKTVPKGNNNPQKQNTINTAEPIKQNEPPKPTTQIPKKPSNNSLKKVDKTDNDEELEFNPPKIEMHKKMSSELKFDELDLNKKSSNTNIENYDYILESEIVSDNHLIDGDDFIENNTIINQIRSIPSIKSSSSKSKENTIETKPRQDSTTTPPKKTSIASIEKTSKVKELLSLISNKASQKEIKNLVQSMQWTDKNMISLLLFGQNCKTAYSFNPYTKTIEEIEIETEDKDYKTPSGYHCINIPPFVYLSGGKNDKNMELDTIYQFVRIGDKKFSLNQLGLMFDKRSFHTSIYIPKRNSLCFISGSRLKTAELFNLDTKAQSSLPLLNSSRERSCACVLNDLYLYVFFGFDRTKSKYVTTIEKINLNKGKMWETISIPGNQNILKKQGFACLNYTVDFKKGILIVGGINSLRNECREVLFYNPDNSTISLHNNLLPENASFTHQIFLNCENDIDNKFYNITDTFHGIIFNKTEGTFETLAAK